MRTEFKNLITKLFTVSIIATLTISCNTTKSITKPNETEDVVQVEYPEVYELSNIILALTEYGKIDKWEVRQNFEFYDKVQEYFKPIINHPLLDSVNYSRKRWEEYLSFRTDAYAFHFKENNKLKRHIDFYANEGVKPFDNHLELINDFVEKSNFRAFYAQNKSYREIVSEKYKETQYLNEMKEFLISQFGEQISSDIRYKVVLSPFVYRMNCHRDIDSTTTADFITIPDYILSDTISITKKKQATSIHNLFTEMDHGYVNPITKKMSNLVAKKFDEKIWNNKSGYENSDNAVFNEYMTWAVYDIFLQKHFPQYAKELGLYWSFQNDTRGFQYSQLFTQKLLTLYNENNGKVKIVDLYPEILNWTSEIQKDLSKPAITFPKDSISLNFSTKTKITISFSEPMKKVDSITTILQDGKNLRKFIDLNRNEHNLQWTKDGLSVEFEIDLPKNHNTYYLQFNWWETKNPIISDKGVLLKSGSYFKIIDE